MSIVTVVGLAATALADARSHGSSTSWPVPRQVEHGARGHDRAEHAAPHGLHLALAAARAARDRRGAGLGAVAAAPVARDEPLDLEVAPGAEHRVAEPEHDAHAEILAVTGARPGPAPARAADAEATLAEEHVEDVLDVVEPGATRTAGASERVVLAALVGVGQDLVGARRLP